VFWFWLRQVSDFWLFRPVQAIGAFLVVLIWLIPGIEVSSLGISGRRRTKE
jgi:hypothetical protein